MKTLTIPLLALCVALGSLTAGMPQASAAPGDVAQAAPEADDKNPALQKKRERIRQRIRALRAWKLTEALELDEATAGKLFPVLNRHDGAIETLLREQRALRRQLKKTLQGSASDKELNQLIDRMSAVQRKLWSAQEARFREVRTVLTPAQAAKIFIILPEIDRRIHRQMMRALKGKKSRTGKARRERKTQQPKDVIDPFE